MTTKTEAPDLADAVQQFIREGLPAHDAVKRAINANATTFNEMIRICDEEPASAEEERRERQAEYGRRLFAFLEDGSMESLQAVIDIRKDTDVFPVPDECSIHDRIKWDLDAIWNFQKLATLARMKDARKQAFVDAHRNGETGQSVSVELNECLNAIIRCQRLQREQYQLFGHLKDEFLSDTETNMHRMREDIAPSLAVANS